MNKDTLALQINSFHYLNDDNKIENIKIGN